MIEANNLTFAYKGKKNTFENINFSLSKGEVMCVLGPNGVGKTTLLKTIMGFYQPVNGTCQIGEISGKKAKLAYVPQAKRVHFSYGVLDFISFGRPLQGRAFASPMPVDIEKASQTLGSLGLSHLEMKDINQISGGELQMCYIAKALVAEPDILVLDEPESNLDFNNQTRIISLLKRLANNDDVTVILNTHFINHVNDIADRCLLMGRKRHFFGDTHTVLQESLLAEYFHVPIKRCQFEHNGVKKESFVVAL